MFGRKKSVNVSNLSDTSAIKVRLRRAEALEKQKLEKKAEIEKIMKEYAKLTGNKELARRKYKVGDAPNDWKPMGR